MAHFARIDEHSIIQQIIFVHDDECAGGYSKSSNRTGQAYIASIGLEGHWEQVRADARLGSRLGAEAGLVEKVAV